VAVGKGIFWWRFTDSNRGPVDYDRRRFRDFFFDFNDLRRQKLLMRIERTPTLQPSEKPCYAA
jgi:hypothetical protein